MDLHSQGFDVVGAVGSAGEVRQVELDLVPSIVQPHGHGADEGLDSGCALVVAGTESPPYILVIKNHNLKGKVLLQIFDDHDQEGKLDPKSLFGVSWTCNICCADISANNFKHQRLNIIICDSLDVTISYVFVPNLKGFASNTV